MVSLTKDNKIFNKAPKCLFIDNEKKVIVYERAGLIFALNLHPTNSYEGYWLTVPRNGKYKVVISSDDIAFGGYDRVSKDYVYTATKHPDKKYKFQIYLPHRSGICMKRVKE